MIRIRKSSCWTSGWKESYKNQHEMVMEPCMEDDSDCSSADERSCEKDEDDNDKEAEYEYCEVAEDNDNQKDRRVLRQGRR